jgi:diguanylate cyclase (GGDEF)-like protein
MRPTLDVESFVRRLPALAPQVVLEAQNQVLELIACNAPLSATLGAIATFAERCIPGMMASILYYDPARGCLTRGGYGALPASFADIVDGLVPGPSMGSCGTCAYTGARIISEDVLADPLWANFLPVCETYGIRSAWSTPLHSGSDGRLLGVFGMYHPQPRAPSEGELEIVDHFTHLASIAAERHRLDSEQRYRASHDALTEIGNRHLLELAGPDILQRHLQSGEPLCVAFIDLDRFKTFNDVFGHLAGDRLLREISRLLREAFCHGELLVRFGGDEFLVIAPAGLEEARARLQTLRSKLDQSVQVGGFGVRVSFSGGLVEYDRQPGNIETLIFAADEAARRAKARGGDCDVVANPVESAHQQHNKLLGVRLAEALDAGHLQAFLQPIVQLAEGQPTGFELLLRLSDPRFAQVPIPQVIAIAEEAGLIHRIGIEMLRHACRLLATHGAALERMTLNVNVSVKQLLQRDFLDLCAATLTEFAVDPARLCLELTESHWLDTDGPAHEVLLALRQLGFTLAIDDFGTGYASLTYLQSLPVSTIKVDKSFIQQAGVSARGRALCSALLAMGQACSMNVVAEGVETLHQGRLLLDMGYPYAQGYLWSRPLACEDALQWLAEVRGGRSRGPDRGVEPDTAAARAATA